MKKNNFFLSILISFSILCSANKSNASDWSKVGYGLGAVASTGIIAVGAKAYHDYPDCGSNFDLAQAVYNLTAFRIRFLGALNMITGSILD